MQFRILQEFAPKPGTKDVNGLFGGFIRSMTASQGKGAPMVMLDSQGKGAPWVASQRGYGPNVQDMAILKDFVARWGLDNQSLKALMSCSSDIQARVLTEFAPKGGTKDMNGLFLGFLKSVSQSASRQGTGVRQTDALSGSNWGGAGALKRAYDANQSVAGTGPKALNQFVTSWQLDNDCVQALEGLPADAQQRIMNEFAPRPGTRDVTSLFLSFVKSVTSYGFPQTKRPRYS